ncbi:Hypothetical predicted protein [Pelobates cultripes]|uniref:PH domain-containing protein n=2 Tax=Pelobates cultripes TaxID=61616 RepID=A0AAD1VWQ1_PELCU|nr:Hypothetical predicted protein [Pelobates cultripes]
MEDGVKGNSNTTPVSQVPVKAGWLKRSSGLLGLWKERYILLLKTQLLLCESEDEQKCLETLELGSYERCQDQKAFLKRKRHFTLIPSPGTKVQDVKFQAKNAEERDTWIQALNEGISRGKNKILDEVKVDNTISLEHVTRDRVKMGAAKRRPPTRVHLKEVAEAASDDSLRLGLDILKTDVLTVVPRIPEEVNIGPSVDPRIPEEVNSGPSVVTNIYEKPEQQKEPEEKEKKTFKIPMPPSKPIPPTSTEVLHPNTTDSDSQMPRPPSPPPKTLKECVYAREKLLSEAEETNDVMKPELKKLSIENLEVTTNTPPKPPPKILSDKMKIKWVGSSSSNMELEGIKSQEKGSKENLVNFDSDEGRRSPSPPPKVLSEVMEAQDLKHSLSSLDGESKGESNQPDDQEIADTIDDLQELSGESSDEQMPTMAEVEEQSEIDEIQTNETLEKKESFEQLNGVLETSEVSDTVPHMTCNLAASNILNTKQRSSSMGDLLSEANTDDGSKNRQKTNVLHFTKDYLYEMEMKLASGREKTETLLNQVLQGQLIKSNEGNGPEVNAEELLNEAVQQLREASQVLQEIKESGNLSNMPETITEKQKEKQKELVTLYRRSVP